MSLEYNEEICYKIISYVDRCFRDAFKAEERNYEGFNYNFSFIIIRIKNTGDSILFPVDFWCKYARVKRRVEYRLKNNLFKKFNLYYMKTDYLSILSYEHSGVYGIGLSNGIDPNHTVMNIEAEIKHGSSSRKTYFWINAVNRNYEEDVDYDLPIIAKQLYYLTLTHFNYKSDQLEKVVNDYEGWRQEHCGIENKELSKKLHLPDTLLHDWTAFKWLYKKTFDREIGEDYEFTFGPSVKIVTE